MDAGGCRFRCPEPKEISVSDEFANPKESVRLTERIADDAGVCLYCGDLYAEHSKAERQSCYLDLLAAER